MRVKVKKKLLSEIKAGWVNLVIYGLIAEWLHINKKV